jgi:hypothetical protein
MVFLNSQVSWLAAGVVAVSGYALAPMAAQGADTPLTGTLSAGLLSNTAPAITPFTATLSGVNQNKLTAVGSWSVTDATGSNAGYSVTVAASAPAVSVADGPDAGIEPDVVHEGTGGTLTLTPKAMTAAAGNPAGTGPVAQAAQLLGTTGVTIQDAPAGTGQGQWDSAADNGTTENSLAVVIPGDASAGDYSSTLTYTTAPPVA